ncbi:diguanylate cyclase [Caldalkalibacillus thermarum TA2.A1]|uniref:Diguanylate cyclase n=1 Tax=Caldalkalibacillus thermarum (strain TA2.A1) TaxID=986075 RepID=A0A8X8IAI4_CALTT|nr:diguanylate cyclase [Caldalkalibacillus thermarum]QZT34816.1 diguanylate cyclase [Caldalkalibacillus thermarum TA2.A1]
MNNKGKPSKYVSIRTDITALKEQEEQAKYQAYYDELTGLYNRRYVQENFDKIIQPLLDDKQRKNGLAVCLVDLDRFQQVNDWLGQRAGDELLAMLGERFRHAIQVMAHFQLAARFGGDEFLLLLAGDNHRKLAGCLNRLARIVFALFNYQGQTIRLSFKVGASFYPQDGLNYDELVTKGDIALYQARESGQDLVIFDAALGEKLERQIEVERRLRQALDQDRLSMVYQPQYHLTSRRLAGLEALLCWQDDQLGPVSPVEVLQVAQNAGSLARLDEWALDRACRDLLFLRQHALPFRRVAVNLSPGFFARQDARDIVQGILQQYGLTGHDLELDEELMNTLTRYWI